MFALILLIAAFVFLAAAAVRYEPSPRIAFMPLGLAFYVLSLLVVGRI